MLGFYALSGAVLLALLMAGCASIPDGSVTFTADEMVTLVSNYTRLQDEVRRLRLEKVPLCNEVRR